MPGPVITLTTDFGTRDPFVGAMKGVILGINPQAAIIDITHDVPPQDILAGSFAFEAACHYFPPGTIHVLVVDPGVGTSRSPLLVIGPAATFVCPDNGILSYHYAEAGFAVPEAGPPTAVPLPAGWQAYRLTNPQYWRQPVSSTFHGRDIFAPVAAYLSRGISPKSLGQPLAEVVALPVPRPYEDNGRLVGCVLQVDRFGNLVTNIPASLLTSLNGRVVVEAGGRRIEGLAGSYQDGEPLVALIGSHGYLEIAAANANAAQVLGVATGAEVWVRRG